METCVRGFPVYKVIWEAAVGEELECRRERGYQVDHYAVAVVKDKTVVSHISQKISRMWSLFSGMVEALLVKLHEQGSTQQTYLRLTVATPSS